MPLPEQAVPTPWTSPTAALQSLSTPSQVSTPGPTPPWHTSMPPEHTVVPDLQAPTQLASNPPGHLAPQALPASVGLSSAWPLQSSSMPLHFSGIGATDC